MSFGHAFRLVAVGLGVLTLVAAVICVVEVVRTRAFVAASTTATGVVVEMVPRQSCEDDEDGDGRRICSVLHAPRIAFTTTDGRDVSFVSSTASNPPSYTEGDVVEVRYRPDRPGAAQVDSVTAVWLGTIVTGSITLAFAFFFVLWVVLAVRFRRL